MSVGFETEVFNLQAGILHWLMVVGVFLAIATVVSVIVSLAWSGPGGLTHFADNISSGFYDTFAISPRRVWALAMLTFKESWRSKAFLVFILFAVLFMFAGWFMPQSDQRASELVQNYVSFVLRVISWLVIPVILLISCWSLPADIKARSLHTVVTKPARRNEVVLGRIFGFTLVSSLILIIMGLVGYGWILRQVTDAARSLLVCRVPVYGQLSFMDREGNPAERGINTGDINEFHSFVEGGTKARAIWDFGPVDSWFLNDGALRLESRFEAFRLYKGNMRRPLFAQYELVDEATNTRIRMPVFELAEFRFNVMKIKPDPDFTGSESVEVRQDSADPELYFIPPDKFETFTNSENLKIEAACMDSGQYIGMARPDLFIRTPDQSFASGFFKSIFCIWLLTILIITLGVTASCFVKGPVASLLCLAFLLIGSGQARGFIVKLMSPKWEGGGPFESIVRMVYHMNPQVALNENISNSIMKAIDSGIMGFLRVVTEIIPQFELFNTTQYVAKGFDVGWNTSILPSIMVTIGFFIPCIIIGYFTLRLRELESK